MIPIYGVFAVTALRTRQGEEDPTVHLPRIAVPHGRLTIPLPSFSSVVNR